MGERAGGGQHDFYTPFDVSPSVFLNDILAAFSIVFNSDFKKRFHSLFCRTFLSTLLFGRFSFKPKAYSCLDGEAQNIVISGANFCIEYLRYIEQKSYVTLKGEPAGSR